MKANQPYNNSIQQDKTVDFGPVLLILTNYFLPLIKALTLRVFSEIYSFLINLHLQHRFG